MEVTIFPSREPLIKEIVGLVQGTITRRPLTIVEIGTIRAKPGEDVPDGGATVSFAGLCKQMGGKLYTVDCDHRHIEYCKEWTKNYADFVVPVLQDGRDFLKEFEGKIDLLYLDGPTENPNNSDWVPGFSRQCLEACISKMSPTSFVMFDDTDPSVWDDKATGCPPILKAARFGPHHDKPIWVRRY